jgi:putative SOS response-associated peptidase YedK
MEDDLGNPLPGFGTPRAHRWVIALLCPDHDERHPLMEPIHHRMPVILDEEGGNLWLSDTQDVPLLKSVLRPYDDARMQAWEISKDVNSPTHNHPGILEAINA